MAKTILIADDDSTVMKLFQLDTESKNVEIVIRSSSNGEETIEAIDAHKPDVVILDIRMLKGDGFHVLDHMKKEKNETPVVILTNYRNEEYAAKSKKYGNVKNYMIKHEVPMNRVIAAINEMLA